MAANDPHPRSDRPSPDVAGCLTQAALHERLEEEIGRAERHGTGLCCLLVVIDNLDELAREHGGELREQTITYVAAVLRRELRRFDRVGRLARIGRAADHDLLIVLPGADGPRGEIVARRALERMRTIKVEAGGTRRPLQISVGLASWRHDVNAESLVASARTAVRSVNSDRTAAQPLFAEEQAAEAESPSSAGADAPAAGPPAVGRAGGP
jgi:diguanylate cyclase (GGDEF)-like protein